jgi:hypothetical protein
VVIINLAETFFDCPAAWQNMITFMQDDKVVDVSDETIALELNKFNARLLYNKGYFVEFETDSDHLLWYLRWT